jgi:hypothetical protein
MNVVPITVEAISNQQNAATAAKAKVMMERKSLDIQAEQGQLLVEMMARSTGTGGNVNTVA